MARLYSTDLIQSSNKNRPGVHAKSISSGLKSSRNYKKKYRGQGR